MTLSTIDTGKSPEEQLVYLQELLERESEFEEKKYRRRDGSVVDVTTHVKVITVHEKKQILLAWRCIYQADTEG